MYQKIISVMVVILLIASAAVCSVYSESTLFLSELQNCKKTYSYSGASKAYFYGFSSNTLYSARVLPDYLSRNITIDGTICAACHDENNAYALYRNNQKKYCVARMNMNNGNCDFYEITKSTGILNEYIAVENNEIFLMNNDNVYASVIGYNFNGQIINRYSLPQGIECIFVNHNQAYAKAYSGNVYHIASGNQTYCGYVPKYYEFSNAGTGYIYVENNILLSLTDGSQTEINGKLGCVVTTGDKLYCYTSAELVAACGASVAILNRNFNCEITDNKSIEHENTIQNTENNTSGKSFQLKGNIIYGIESGTTVTQLVKAYPSITSVFNTSGARVTSGKITTGCSAQTNSGTYLISVRGDVTGEGNVNSRDIKALMQHLTDEEILSGCYAVSADYNFDDKIDNKDLMLIAQSY